MVDDEMNVDGVSVKTLKVDIDELALTEKNPRRISKKDYETLKRSLKNFPSMLAVREIVVDENMRVLGGHQRIRVLKEQGEQTVIVKQVVGWTDEQKDEFLIKDNIANGDWDNDRLANEWNKDQLGEWGLPIRVASDDEYRELLDVTIPHYTPSEDKPDAKDLADTAETDSLIEEVESVEMPAELKKLFLTRAAFFTDFDFQKIADYYAHSSPEIQALMKKLGLVIVIPREAYELGMCDFSKSFGEDEL